MGKVKWDALLHGMREDEGDRHHPAPFLNRTLQVSGADVSGMGLYCARLANALVAVAGPEFTLGSTQYRIGRYGHRPYCPIGIGNA